MKYTKTHEWVNLQDDIATVGITQYAQKELGDVVYVELPVSGLSVKEGEVVSVLESTKAAADIYAPISGTITEVNQSLKEKVELVNQSPESEGWLYKLRINDPQEVDHLLDTDAYQAMIS